MPPPYINATKRQAIDEALNRARQAVISAASPLHMESALEKLWDEIQPHVQYVILAMYAHATGRFDVNAIEDARDEIESYLISDLNKHVLSFNTNDYTSSFEGWAANIIRAESKKYIHNQIESDDLDKRHIWTFILENFDEQSSV